MQAQKLDLKKTYGQVFNHDVIAYEQEGRHFDAGGDLVSGEGQVQPEEKKKDKEPGPGATPEAFLRHLLSGGPITQAIVKKESENVDLIWIDVQLAATTIGIEKFKQGKITMWKLGEQ